jgi:putative transposase
MRRNKLALFIHLVWATWDRQPLVTADIERRIYRNIESEVSEMGCKVLAINGMPEHVHLVVTIPSTISIADLAKQVKGVSSHFVNETLKPGIGFKWQGSYGAFTVSRWDVDKIVNYVKGQKRHHHEDDLLMEWEQTFEEVSEAGG